MNYEIKFQRIISFLVDFNMRDWLWDTKDNININKTSNFEMSFAFLLQIVGLSIRINVEDRDGKGRNDGKCWKDDSSS